MKLKTRLYPLFRQVCRALRRVVFFAFLWWVLTEGDAVSWGLGIPAVLAATWISLASVSAMPWRWRLVGVLRFLPFFLWHSCKGSVDVAQRALQWSPALRPVLIRYPWHLPPGPARIFFANAANLLPGTLSAELHDERLTMHVISDNHSLMTELQALEAHVATLFGLPLSQPNGAGEQLDGGTLPG